MMPLSVPVPLRRIPLRCTPAATANIPLHLVTRQRSTFSTFYTPHLPARSAVSLPLSLSSVSSFSSLSTLHSLAASANPTTPAPSTMPGQKIDGTAIAKGIREEIKNEIVRIQEVNPRFKPCLTIIQGVNVLVHDIYL